MTKREEKNESVQQQYDYMIASYLRQEREQGNKEKGRIRSAQTHTHTDWEH